MALSLGLLCGAPMAPPTGTDWLSDGERRRWAQQSSVTRRREFLQGRWLLRLLLPGSEPRAAADIDAWGRSHICTPGCGPYANVSHSAEAWLAAIASAPVGVDLETIRPRPRLLELATHVMSAADCRELEAAALPQRLNDFYAGWTLREAWQKSYGRGLDLLHMRNLQCERVQHGGNAASLLLPHQRLMLAVAMPNGLPQQLPSPSTIAWAACSECSRWHVVDT